MPTRMVSLRIANLFQQATTRSRNCNGRDAKAAAAVVVEVAVDQRLPLASTITRLFLPKPSHKARLSPPPPPPPPRMTLQTTCLSILIPSSVLIPTLMVFRRPASLVRWRSLTKRPQLVIVRIYYHHHHHRPKAKRLVFSSWIMDRVMKPAMHDSRPWPTCIS